MPQQIIFVYKNPRKIFFSCSNNNTANLERKQELIIYQTELERAILRSEREGVLKLKN